MLNIVDLEKRYKNIKFASYYTGGNVYLINSDEELSLNRCDGYILNSEGLVQEFKFNDSVQASHWCRDSEGTDNVSDEEVLSEFKQGNFRFTDNLFLIDNPDYVIKTYRAKPEDYYPHPWYPDRKIISFECIRMAPMWTYGNTYEVFADSDGTEMIEGNDVETRLWIDEVLNYPEFFKPIYANEQSDV